MRKTILTAAATAALLAFGAASAQAECAQGNAGISKDGSLAPMQQSADAGSNAPGSTGTTTGPASEGAQADAQGSGQGSGEIAKDGSTAPLASAPGGGADVATSPDDVQRQQQGETTAAAEGQASTDTSC